MYKIGIINDNIFCDIIANPIKLINPPKYMGFLEYLYAPRMTSTFGLFSSSSGVSSFLNKFIEMLFKIIPEVKNNNPSKLYGNFIILNFENKK